MTSPAPYWPLRNDAFEVAVVQRMVLDVHRKPPVARHHRRPLGHRPRRHRAVGFEAKIVVQARGAVHLYRRSAGACRPRSALPARLGRRLEVALLVIGLERSGRIAGMLVPVPSEVRHERDRRSGDHDRRRPIPAARCRIIAPMTWELALAIASLLLAATAYVRSRTAGGFYDAEVYGMTPVAHRRYAAIALALRPRVFRRCRMVRLAAAQRSGSARRSCFLPCSTSPHSSAEPPKVDD